MRTNRPYRADNFRSGRQMAYEANDALWFLSTLSSEAVLIASPLFTPNAGGVTTDRSDQFAWLAIVRRRPRLCRQQLNTDPLSLGPKIDLHPGDPPLTVSDHRPYSGSIVGRRGRT